MTSTPRRELPVPWGRVPIEHRMPVALAALLGACAWGCGDGGSPASTATSSAGGAPSSSSASASSSGAGGGGGSGPAWENLGAPSGQGYRAVCVDPTGNVFAGANVPGHPIQRWDGAWHDEPSCSAPAGYSALWCAEDGTVWALGQAGPVCKRATGGAWSVDLPIAAGWAMHGRGEEVWYVGTDAGIMRRDASGTWAPEQHPLSGVASAMLDAVWATPGSTDVWAAGVDDFNAQALLHRDADGTWTRVTLPALPTLGALEGVWASPTEVWLAGGSTGAVVRGPAAWVVEVEAPAGKKLHAVLGAGDRVWAGGEPGVLFDCTAQGCSDDASLTYNTRAFAWDGVRVYAATSGGIYRR